MKSSRHDAPAKLLGQPATLVSAMPELYIAADSYLEERMFPDDDGKPCMSVPGFISSVEYVPFKDTIDDAIEAAIRARCQACEVIRGNTTWVVRKFHLSFDEIGRLTHANTLKRTRRGYQVFKTLAKPAEKLSVPWPRWTVKKYLVNRGYKISDQVDKACVDSKCWKKHSTMYHWADDEFMCETCLAEQERIGPAMIALSATPMLPCRTIRSHNV